MSTVDDTLYVCAMAATYSVKKVGAENEPKISIFKNINLAGQDNRCIHAWFNNCFAISGFCVTLETMFSSITGLPFSFN